MDRLLSTIISSMNDSIAVPIGISSIKTMLVDAGSRLAQPRENILFNVKYFIENIENIFKSVASILEFYVCFFPLLLFRPFFLFETNTRSILLMRDPRTIQRTKKFQLFVDLRQLCLVSSQMPWHCFAINEYL